MTDPTARVAFVFVALLVVCAALALTIGRRRHERNATRRALTFLFGCMMARFLIALLAYRERGSARARVLAALALIPAAGFIYIYVNGLRKTGPETAGEAIWWNDLRPVHAALWIAFAVAAFARSELAWTFLAADLALGLGAWFIERV